MRHVGNEQEHGVQFCLDLLLLFLNLAHLIAELFCLGFQCFSFARVLHLSRKLVLSLLNGLSLGSELLALIVKCDDLIDIGVDVAILAVRLDCFEVLANEMPRRA